MGIVAVITIIIIILVIRIIIKIKSNSDYKSYETPEEKGKDGEFEVSEALGEDIENQKYIFNNVIFADNKGNTCQIDHIVINKNGIWVIETKNYSGMIFGNEKEIQWTQMLAYGKEKYILYNPILQNQTHIYRLSEYLKAKNIFNNVIVFTGNANINNVTANQVCNIDNLPYLIQQKTNINLNQEQILLYKDKITELIEKNNITEEEHIRNVKQLQQNIENNICPRCGGELKLKNGKYGKFYGCENYPNCKFTKKY